MGYKGNVKKGENETRTRQSWYTNKKLNSKRKKNTKKRKSRRREREKKGVTDKTKTKTKEKGMKRTWDGMEERGSERELADK